MWIYTSTPIRLRGVVLNELITGTTLPLHVHVIFITILLIQNKNYSHELMPSYFPPSLCIIRSAVVNFRSSRLRLVCLDVLCHS
jgi:hypothetical protein